MEGGSQLYSRGSGLCSAVSHANWQKRQRSNILATGRPHWAIPGVGLQGCEAKLGDEAKTDSQTG